MEKVKETLKLLPHAPGVYLYKDQVGHVIYVGKARDLSLRVKQYFAESEAASEKTQHLVAAIAQIDTIKTDSEFDALLLEAQLIRTYNPKYNIIAKDDKSPLYIALTLDESLPRVLFLRKTQLSSNLPKRRVIFGPFQSSRTARLLLRTLRAIIPYCSQKQCTGKPCFYTNLGLCQPCPSYIAKLPDTSLKKLLTIRYRRNIIRLKDILSGYGFKVRRTLESEMKKLAKENKFEEAGVLKKQIDELYQLQTRRFDPTFYLTQTSLLEDARQQEIEALRSILLPSFALLGQLHRIECIDISHTGVSESSGSLVVLSDGIVDTSQYRRFHIRSVKAPNDVGMISEVLNRRLKHTEWPYPDLLIVDGGKGQVGAAKEVLDTANLDIPVIGLAKRFEEIVVPYGNEYRIVRLPLTNPAIHIMQRIRDEAHRFAKSYQYILRRNILAHDT